MGAKPGYYQKIGGDAIVFGVGNLELAHKLNEFADIRELNEFYAKLKNIINYVCKK